MRHLILAGLLLLVGCAHVPPTPRVQLPALELAPASFGGSVSLVQRLTLDRVPSGPATQGAAAARQLDALLEIDSERVQLAGFVLGQRVITLGFDGRTLAVERHALIPAELDARRILRDIELVYWPASAISEALPDQWSLIEDGNTRSLMYRGVTEVVVRYSGEPRWNGQAQLDNQIEGYGLTIDSHSADNS